MDILPATRVPDQSPRRRITGRLAPSPTGGLHLGHARTFLVAWLASRASAGGGRVVLRLEDIDASRVRPEALASIVRDLEWLGLDWDEGPIRQSNRVPLYADALERLKRAEAVYPCLCTRADIQRAASAPHEPIRLDAEGRSLTWEVGPAYPGTCAGRSVAEAAELARAGRAFAWRFRVADPNQTIVWEDEFLGPIALTPRQVGGDFVVGRSSGEPSYQLAAALDDALMGVDLVVRGDDLIPSTPRQILIQRALGHASPRFFHLPLALAPDGQRLAKRDAALKLETLRGRGVAPEAIIGEAARSCGWLDPNRPAPLVRPRDLIPLYDPRRIPRVPWIVPATWM
ncbi:Glutamyl/glutaminyl-tRNA synthetase, class Ic, catalytic domain protein [Isosphaera pallida ATCC 43644]|uniref:Glutamyl/glutaminyl-tRNA synthetase, class Ic, catalytic domain protein n=1 Tax=Isosphaera pallida (strain ATCC 43644 / DSM 9630 / IS1B) TaxID=575540 RepID=E8R513_ISOPI|nr:tRNA glutamyl-Q(34) synthetase GluQRS [Isosphaera pallida]ADV62770.1 Glutamyl/glutaminyl-tRNA synthetase, class Ic, catalytic domain protein [Isosphaera pallida ATCC 43644]